MIDEAIAALAAGKSLDFTQAEGVMNEIMNGEAGEIKTAAYLTALSIKGETVEEIVGSAKAMREHATLLPADICALEIVGTGGDKSNSFNISTTSAIVLSSLGVKVAKHGNRAATSKCGAADVLEALGVKIDISPERSAEILREVGVCFLFAQKYHSAMKFVAPVRKSLPIHTVFNVLGPLTNPAKIKYQLMGVYDKELVEPMARVLSRLGIARGMVFFGTDGLDEISPSAPTIACRFEGEKFENLTITPADFGFETANKADLIGGTPAENAQITRAILQGEKSPRRNAVVMNASYGLNIYDGTPLEKAQKLVERALDDGAAYSKLQQYIKASNQ